MPRRKPYKKRAGHKSRTFTYETMDLLIREYKGNISAMAEASGVAPATIKKFIYDVKPDGTPKRKRLIERIEEQREVRLDRAEYRLDEAIDRGEPWAITLMLKTLGRKRGYQEKIEVDSTRSAPQITEVTIVHNQTHITQVADAIGGGGNEEGQDQGWDEGEGGTQAELPPGTSARLGIEG